MEKSENDRLAENLHAIIQKETREKEDRQRAQREHRAGAQAAVDAAIEALAGVDEIIAKDQENPAKYLATRPRISVPAGQLQRSKRGAIYDKGLPPIHDLYFREMQRVDDWDTKRLAESRARDLNTEGFDQTACTIAILQEHKRVGQKMCAVSAGELTLAENTDSLRSITGGDVTEVLPSIGFWFKRRILNTPSHFLLVSVFRDAKKGSEGVMTFPYRLSDRETEPHALEVPFPLGEGQRCVGGMAISDFGDGLNVPNGLPTPGWMEGGENEPVTQSLAVPLITNMTIWDSYLGLLPEGVRPRMVELYEGTGKPADGTAELFFLKCISHLRVIVSCMGIMASVPEYVGSRVVQERVFDKDARNRNERRKGRETTRTIMELRNPVPEDPPVVGSGGVATGTRRVHWRRGHFTRRPHGVRWELANPDRPVIMFPDGRRGHQVWVKPTIVRPRKDGESD